MVAEGCIYSSDFIVACGLHRQGKLIGLASGSGMNIRRLVKDPRHSPLKPKSHLQVLEYVGQAQAGFFWRKKGDYPFVGGYLKDILGYIGLRASKECRVCFGVATIGIIVSSPPYVCKLPSPLISFSQEPIPFACPGPKPFFPLTSII